MDLTTLTTWIRTRYHQLRTARDAGQSSTEVAVIAGALILGAALLVVAIKSKLAEKIGIIDGS
ncbi:hypothetical protein AB0I82_35780 [Streptomyces sp. NPDC050315]|uniref:hypothetical protein n=1 Tax=Streptomyces sp. NPDC050315 TaxID=3155039 RepID=UPI00342AF4C3